MSSRRYTPGTNIAIVKKYRESIKEVFGFEISSETFRPLFTKLKAEIFHEVSDEMSYELDEIKKNF
jgi:hypothetical protein